MTDRLGIYRHGDHIQHREAVQLAAHPAAFMWALVPLGDNSLCVLRRRDKITPDEARAYDRWRVNNHRRIQLQAQRWAGAA